MSLLIIFWTIKKKFQPKTFEKQQFISSNNDVLELIKEESENDEELKDIDRKYLLHEIDNKQASDSNEDNELKEIDTHIHFM